ncbi:MAG: hypothetical protein BWY32_02954 [bacterium ADurb.Bin243]|nr:MAG: hypothetical protein BWY32_02954 [bacterium ADurb.Bin243]HOD42438.1 hypothetical protein [Candidatus Wallbacteria bacterium]
MADKKIDSSAVKNKVPKKTMAVITAALSMYLQNEKLNFKILDIKPVHSSDLNIWGLFSRMTGMQRLSRNKWGRR